MLNSKHYTTFVTLTGNFHFQNDREKYEMRNRGKNQEYLKRRGFIISAYHKELEKI